MIRRGGGALRRKNSPGGMPNQGIPGGRPPVGGGVMHGGELPGISPTNWQQNGFDSKAAQQSVTKQYGLIRGENGWQKPTMDWFQNQMTSQGWGPTQTADTPVGIGGARWMAGPSGLNFTGQASDAQFGRMPMGQAYDSTTQTPYSPGGGRIRRRGGTFGTRY